MNDAISAKKLSYKPQLTEAECLAIDALRALPPVLSLEDLPWARPFSRREPKPHECAWRGCKRGANGARASFIPISRVNLHCSPDCRAAHEAEEKGDSPQTREFGQAVLHDQAFVMSANRVCYNKVDGIFPVGDLPGFLGISPNATVALILLRGVLRTCDVICKTLPPSKKRNKVIFSKAHLDPITVSLAESSLRNGNWRGAYTSFCNLTETIKKMLTSARRRERLAKRPRHRPMSNETKLRITLAASLSNDGLTPYMMKGQLFPTQRTGGTRQYDSVKKLFSRNREKIDLEKARLRSLPEREQKLIAADARDLLNRGTSQNIS
jgi:hypothetical protein